MARLPSRRLRAVNRGSSASTVPTPAMTASTVPRSACTSIRAASEVIHMLVPSAAAERPSSVAAYFQITYGQPRRIEVNHATLPASASSPRTPRSTRTPAARKVAAPPEATGFGSGTAMTTRPTPAWTSAELQGPVRPV
ncbi:hypothetical protein PSN01_02558 [Micromonospora saelicesensis]|nr:hypothetical protein PSN01_02558 [Micromonospora saelicesensis]